ncbi:hypothetical protein ZIOFF_069840 [Zingiber officinale]|uniref:Uncharacterized protein n=1 Tax=Zingiber officinale TaxID=94328 RepID=A0A8J5C4P9_ZINOF|nr:hypothetical protein ZIOFF_069840 [Zingiber officinale]
MIVNTNEAVCDSVDNLANDILLDALDDDQLLQSIDVDQIVMEHYQVTGTPEGSVSKHAPFTPVSRSYIGHPREDTLPLKLCELCIHGSKCPGASVHLQQMKDRLITVSTELLDNAFELCPEHYKNLNQEQFVLVYILHLKNKIQHLEKDLSLSNQDEERQRSSFAASTTTSRNFQLERPSSMTDPVNFNSQAYIRNEPGDTMTWSSPTPSYYANQFGTTSADRQVFTPKLLDINYIEGSGDKK